MSRRPKQKQKPADWLIQQRRAQEAKRDDLQATVRYNFLVGSRSHWENKTQKVIEKNRAHSVSGTKDKVEWSRSPISVVDFLRLEVHSKVPTFPHKHTGLIFTVQIVWTI